MKSRKQYSLFILLLGLVILSQAYTNCGPNGAFPVEIPSVNLDSSHPGADTVNPAQYVMPLGHRGFISSIMTDIFSNANSSAAYVSSLNAAVQIWSGNQGADLGLACNPYDANSGTDCGGNISNANLPIERQSTIVREADRIHLCNEILGTDEAVTTALANANVTATTPDATSIRAVAALFYRGDSPSDDFFNALVSMDQDMANESTTPIDRWRMMLTMICESPDWQRL